MADTAWTNIKVGDENGVELIEAGDSVSGLSDDEMEQLREAGAVRDQDYPDDIQEGESVRERNIRVVNEKMEEIQAQGFDMSDVEIFPVDPPVAPIETEEVSAPKQQKSAAKASSGGASGSS